jgi:hypothetical protein
MAIIKKIGTSHLICKAPRVSEGNASRACLKARSHTLHETLGKVPALRILIYFFAFLSGIVYSLPLWPDLYDLNMKVQCTT